MRLGETRGVPKSHSEEDDVAKAVIRKPPPKKESAEQNPEKWVAHHFEFRHQFLVGVKTMEGGELIPDVGTWEEVQEEIRELLKKRFPHGMFTPSGGYLLIREDDGKVRACYPHDFDYGTMDRKPGTVPPLYTLSQEEQKEVRELQREVERRVEREKANGNELARNPTNLLTARETAAAKRIVRTRPKPAPEKVEWTEDDAGDEALAEKETAKLLQGMPSRRRPVRRVKRK